MVNQIVFVFIYFGWGQHHFSGRKMSRLASLKGGFAAFMVFFFQERGRLPLSPEKAGRGTFPLSCFSLAGIMDKVEHGAKKGKAKWGTWLSGANDLGVPKRRGDHTRIYDYTTWLSADTII